MTRLWKLVTRNNQPDERTWSNSLFWRERYVTLLSYSLLFLEAIEWKSRKKMGEWGGVSHISSTK